MLLDSSRLTFGLIQKRLLEALRHRLRNGDFTERGLARVAGISQPHIHNVLKGVRTLSPDLSDLLIASLDLSLIELLGADELGEALIAKQARRLGTHSVPMLMGRLGPEDPFPSWRAVSEWVVARNPQVRALRRPAFVQLGADPALSPAWTKLGFGLLDFDEACRAEPALPGWYALRWRGAAFIRQVRVEERGVDVLGQRTLEVRTQPEWISLGDGSLLQTVRARLAWVGPDPVTTGWQPQAGLWLPRAARS